jgi:hypothetical protein
MKAGGRHSRITVVTSVLHYQTASAFIFLLLEHKVSQSSPFLVIAARASYRVPEHSFKAGTRVPATVSAIAGAIQWAEQIMARIDQRWPVK